MGTVSVKKKICFIELSFRKLLEKIIPDVIYYLQKYASTKFQLDADDAVGFNSFLITYD